MKNDGQSKVTCLANELDGKLSALATTLRAVPPRRIPSSSPRPLPLSVVVMGLAALGALSFLGRKPFFRQGAQFLLKQLMEQL